MNFPIKCSCGHVFDGMLAPARPAKEQRGHFLNNKVRQHSTTGNGASYEHQCPSCKLWFDDFDLPEYKIQDL